MVWVDGHSDYGHALEVFWDTYGKEVGPKTTVLILGDARNNYHASQAWITKEIQKRARKLFWLNPEPQAYWNTGDSIVGEYGAHCDGTCSRSGTSASSKASSTTSSSVIQGLAARISRAAANVARRIPA